jgi:enoyl-CoA hydratase
VRIGLAEYAVPLAAFDDAIEDLSRVSSPTHPFLTARNNRLLESTGGLPLEVGLRWEVSEHPDVGPDMQDPIEALTSGAIRASLECHRPIGVKFDYERWA